MAYDQFGKEMTAAPVAPPQDAESPEMESAEDAQAMPVETHAALHAHHVQKAKTHASQAALHLEHSSAHSVMADHHAKFIAGKK